MGSIRIQGKYKLLPLVFLCLYFVFRSLEFPLHDFSNYYFAAYFLRFGQFNESLYFPHIFNYKIAELGFQGQYASFAPNSPFLAFLLTPFSFVAPLTAKIAFNLISIAFFLFALYRLFSYYKINWNYTFGLPILFFLPIQNEILFGQLYFLVFFLLVEFWIAYEQNRMAQSMFFLGLAIVLKVFPAIFVFLFLFKKQLKPILYLGLFCCLFALMTVPLVGFNTWIFYVKNILPKTSAGEISGEYVRNYQSLMMFLKELFVRDSTYNPKAPFHYPALIPSLLLAIKIFILGVGFYLLPSLKNGLMTLSFWIMAAILFSPYGSTYTFLLLLIPLLALMNIEGKKTLTLGLIFLLFVINNLPLHFFINKDFPFAYLRLYFYLLFCIAFISTYFKSIKWGRIGMISLAGLSLGLLFYRPQQSLGQKILGKKAPLLLYDFTIKDQKLVYQYWDEKGAQKDSFSLKYYSAQRLSLKENKVSDEQSQIDLGKGNIRQAMLLDKNKVIYLTDENRGIGFFKLMVRNQ